MVDWNGLSKMSCPTVMSRPLMYFPSLFSSILPHELILPWWLFALIVKIIILASFTHTVPKPHDDSFVRVTDWNLSYSLKGHIWITLWWFLCLTVQGHYILLLYRKEHLENSSTEERKVWIRTLQDSLSIFSIKEDYLLSLWIPSIHCSMNKLWLLNKIIIIYFA